MKDTIFYIAEIKRTQGITSDYAVSKLIGVTRQNMTAYKQGRSSLDSDACLMVGELLNISPLEVVANVKASKSKDPLFMQKWQALAKQLSTMTIAVILSVSVLFAPAKSEANTSIFNLECRGKADVSCSQQS